MTCAVIPKYRRPVKKGIAPFSGSLVRRGDGVMLRASVAPVFG